MIAMVDGKVVTKALDHAVLDVQGVGFAVYTTPETLSRLHTGAESRLFTSLVVREDSLTLFGFVEADDRDVFNVLQTVSGVGPKLALAILAVLTPDTLGAAVANEDVATLTRVPGVGKKSASRLILELQGKIAFDPATGGASATTGSSGASAATPAGPGADIVQALVGLGYSTVQAEAAVAATTEQATSDASDWLKAALQHLSRGA